MFINGLGFSPDGTGLIVTTTSSAQLWGYRVQELPGGPDAEVLCTFDNGWPDGMAVGHAGDMWVALTGGDRLDHVSASGQILGHASLGSRSLPTNVSIGGPHENELYVSAPFQQALVRIRR